MSQQDAPEGKPRRSIAVLLGRSLTGVVVLGLVGVVVAAGFYEVEPDEEAVVLRLGRLNRTLGPGLHWRLVGVETIEKERVTVTKEEVFGFRLLDPGPPPKYEERPDEKRMLTGDANVINAEFVLQYRITDLANYLFRVREVQQVIRDVAESAVREVVAKHAIDSVLTRRRGAIQSEAKLLIQNWLDEYEAGVYIQNLQLQDVEPPEPVKEAFADVANAEQDRERLILEAQGYADQVVPRARGEAKELVNQAQAYRESRILEARGEADRFLALLEQYRKAPGVTRERLYLETIQVVLPGVEKVIIEQGQANQVLPYLPLSRRGRVE